MSLKVSILTLLFLVCCMLPGCSSSPRYVSDEEMPDIDTYTMSLGLDRKDLNRLYMDIAPEMFESAIVHDWDRMEPPPVVAILPMRNETSEHIEPQLDTLLSKMETDFVNQTRADVVSRENQVDLIAEIRNQMNNPAFDPARIPSYGKQLGAQYVITGKVYDKVGRSGDQRRVQYFLFMQIIDVSTGVIKFQKEASITKGLVK